MRLLRKRTPEVQGRGPKPDQVVDTRASAETGRQDAAAIRIADLGKAAIGVAKRSRRFDHPPEPLPKPWGEWSSTPFGHRIRQQKDLEREPMVRKRRLEPDSVVVHLFPDLALESGMSLAEPLRAIRVAC